MNHTKMSAVAVFVALSLAVAGCSNDEPADASDASSASSRTTQTSVDATTTAPTSSAVPAQGGVITPKPPKEVGGTQSITGQGFTAQIQVEEPAIVEGRWGAALLTFPISINVESGALVASPDHWAVRTLNSGSVKGINNQGVTNEIGTASIDSRAEGLIPFVDFSSKLSEDVSITEIALYSDSNLGNHWLVGRCRHRSLFAISRPRRSSFEPRNLHSLELNRRSRRSPCCDGASYFPSTYPEPSSDNSRFVTPWPHAERWSSSPTSNLVDFSDAEMIESHGRVPHCQGSHTAQASYLRPLPRPHISAGDCGVSRIRNQRGDPSSRR